MPLRPVHILLLILILLLVFGASKLPDLARSLGKSAKIMKQELRELSEDTGGAEKNAAPTTREAAAPAPQGQFPVVPAPAAPPATPAATQTAPAPQSANSIAASGTSLPPVAHHCTCGCAGAPSGTNQTPPPATEPVAPAAPADSPSTSHPA